ncbi:Bromodomain containing protein [Tritrichomonas foetus]|uniref:Bromodomain containing protein n=1 Tax=Tritrichomonas foetus TaxID=1144522 RepID=A0A1J4L443_9EUKA|nr:Bromodomain containing protein [Tritrichomonas foetus]|eukprot:OHT16748.1 Bromodomain containing protein [Tritrichomonas foetus]
MSGFTRVELDYCKKVTEKLIGHPLSTAFLRPVNPQLDGAPDYLQKISRPMDLGTIKSKLENNSYSNSREWETDIRLVWSNAMKYNPKKTLLHHVAERLNQKCNKLLKAIPKTEPELWAMKLTKLNHKMKTFLNENPPEESIVPRRPELALKIE